MPGVGQDTQSFEFCSQHIDLVREIERCKTKLDELDRSNEANWKRTDETADKVRELKGAFDSTMPLLRGSIDKLLAQKKIDPDEAEMYFAKIRHMSSKANAIEAALEKVLTREQVEKKIKEAVENLATKESVKNCYTWVKVGFASLAGSVFLFILYFVLKALGVPLP
jgi:hypothetical protein